MHFTETALLPRAFLDDPAFSPDPRSHPHYTLADACSYTTLPDDLAFTLPALSSHSPAPSPREPPRPPLPPKPDIPPRQVLKPVSTNIPCKARMKAFVRRLTSRHNLDRIDELDETDPFGTNYHHDGPYEAIATNLEQSTLPRTRGSAPPPGYDTFHSTRESDPHLLGPSRYRSASQSPSIYGETGLSLHLEPGQILQRNNIYTTHTSAILGPFHTQPNAVSVSTRRDHSRRQSLPNPQTQSSPDPSSRGLRISFQNQSLSVCAPRERYLGEYTPDIPSSPPIDHDHEVPYVLHQPEKTVLPPPRYESRLRYSGDPQSPQRTSPPPSSLTTPRPQPTENVVPAPLLPGPRHRSVHPLNNAHTTVVSTPSSSIQHQSLDLLRIRHLPKRLVMPAPLQPQPPQPQCRSPPVELRAWQDEYPDRHVLESAHFEGKPAMYSQEPRLLRKKSSAFPAKSPIPDHVSMSQDDAVAIMGNLPRKTANEAEGTKGRTRRRRLSKRKSDI